MYSGSGSDIYDLIHFLIILPVEPGITLAFCCTAAKPKDIRKNIVSPADTFLLTLILRVLDFGDWIVLFIYLAAAFLAMVLLYLH